MKDSPLSPQKIHKLKQDRKTSRRAQFRLAIPAPPRLAGAVTSRPQPVATVTVLSGLQLDLEAGLHPTRGSPGGLDGLLLQI